MNIKSLIAAATIASVLTIAIPATQTLAGDVNLHVDFNAGAVFSSHYGFHAHNPSHIRCWMSGRIAEPAALNSVDCKLPGHKYSTWQKDSNFLGKVNGYGGITGVSNFF